MSTEFCARRRTKTLGIRTPLLVPSFSSRGYPGLAEIIEAIRPEIADACLVSAYDVSSGQCPGDFERLANIVVVDSGLYECGDAPVAVDAHLPRPTGSEWQRDAYRRFIRGLGDRWASTNALLVSYDTYASFEEQVLHARDDFKGIDGVATALLLKPEEPGHCYDHFLGVDGRFEMFDVVGVTERELGSSALARCRAVIQLRTALTHGGHSKPIHVFGSITPAAVTAYFLCGADVFDGLNWLRASFDLAWAGAPSEFAVAHGMIATDDRDVLLELWRRNLRVLRRTQAALARFAEEGDVERLISTLPFAKASLELAKTAIDAERG